MLKFILPLLALPLLALPATPALAQETTQSVKVSLAGLDLSTRAGRKAANGRIRSAVRTLCPVKIFPSLTEHWEGQECRRGAYFSSNAAMKAAVQRARRDRAGGAVLAGR